MVINFYNCDFMDHTRSLPDNYYKLGICDPPYGLGEDGGRSASRCRAKGVTPKNYEKKGWDAAPVSADALAEIKRVCENVVLWGADHYMDRIMQAWRDGESTTGIEKKMWLVWDKVNGANDFADVEMAWTDILGAARLFRWQWHGFIQDSRAAKVERVHPTEKPKQLYKWILEKFTEPGDSIFDPYGGSMSHAHAAYETGRNLDICEIDPGYFADGVARFRKKVRTTPLNANLEFINLSTNISI